MNVNRIDWFKVILHFVCGAVVGALVGLGLWVNDCGDGDSFCGGAFWIGGGAIVVGLLAGVFLDRFWDALKDRWGRF